MADDVLQAIVRHVADEGMTDFFASHQIAEANRSLTAWRSSMADRVVAVLVQLVPPGPRRLATLFVILLGAAGLSSESNGALFTLALPLSRHRLLAIRAAAGLGELFILTFVPAFLIPLFALSIDESYSMTRPTLTVTFVAYEPIDSIPFETRSESSMRSWCAATVSRAPSQPPSVPSVSFLSATEV